MAHKMVHAGGSRFLGLGFRLNVIGSFGLALKDINAKA